MQIKLISQKVLHWDPFKKRLCSGYPKNLGHMAENGNATPADYGCIIINGTLWSRRKFTGKSGPPSDEVFFDRSVRSDSNLSFHFKKFSFPVWRISNQYFSRNLHGYVKNFASTEKCRSIISWLVPVVSDQSVWRNGNHHT